MAIWNCRPDGSLNFKWQDYISNYFQSKEWWNSRDIQIILPREESGRQMRVWASKEVLKMRVFKLERWDLDKEASIKMISINLSNTEKENRLNKWKLRTVFMQL